MGWSLLPHGGATQVGSVVATRMLVALVVQQSQTEMVPEPLIAPTDPPKPAPAPSPVVPQQTEGLKVVAEPDPSPRQAAPAPSLPPAPAYHTSQGLNPPPRFLNDVEPIYPAGASLQEGSVVLRFLISATGEIENVAVVRSTPPGVFDEAALAAYSKARFSPGYLLGIPVRSQKTIEVLFTPINRGGAVDGTAPRSGQ